MTDLQAKHSGYWVLDLSQKSEDGITALGGHCFRQQLLRVGFLEEGLPLQVGGFDEIAVNDSKTYAKPFTLSLPLTSPPGYQLLPYECLEGDYAVKNALSAERAEDKALEEDAKKGIVRARRAVTQENVNAPVNPNAPRPPGAE